ncbi:MULTISPECIES: pyroglutamyl-peptidase I [Bhargavaea]|uniref:Pyrrolidone-carboxylate peptidase n=1 Tax=Bhargavaea changchunensis TaxID=2134037 RepID=A0ABW2NDG3_9BACL|nr:pyroglutamyl-peptidase I [Bhargavaea sp. CC-171006]
MKTILLTGFEPFLDYPVNPTMRIAEELDRAVIGDYQICTRILPVDFSKASARLIGLIREVEPDVTVSLGLAAGRYKITPERIAVNVKDGAADNEGHTPVDEPIEEEAADAYFSTLPVRGMVNALLEAGLPAEISNTAGAYLCNNVMYAGLHYAKTENPEMKSGFIHIPASHELGIRHGKIPSWSHEDLLRGVRICLETIAGKPMNE